MNECTQAKDGLAPFFRCIDISAEIRIIKTKSGWGREKEVKAMNMQEMARFILGLRDAGWSEKEINDFMLFIESGEEKYKPKRAERKENR